MTGPVPALSDRALACAGQLLDADHVLLASHIDADGLTSAAVASEMLMRAGIEFEAVFKNQLDSHEIDSIAKRARDTVLFTDFGSGQLDDIAAHERAGSFTPVVVDHHQPADAETRYHLNPLLEGLDGASELSGAGAAYLVARALAERSPAADGGTVEMAATRSSRADNQDLAALAVVGAVGDMQASDGGLAGANSEIVAEGVAAGVVEEATDLAVYGKQTRPLPKLLEYATDVFVPGISNSRSGALEFLTGLDIELKSDGEWQSWVALDASDRQTVARALIRRAIERGFPPGRSTGSSGRATP